MSECSFILACPLVHFGQFAVAPAMQGAVELGWPQLCELMDGGIQFAGEAAHRPFAEQAFGAVRADALAGLQGV